MLAERTLLIICHCVEIILIHCTTIKVNGGLKNIMYLSYEIHELAQNIIMVHPKHIMRREGRGKERAMTMHLINIHVFTHGSRVTKYSLYDLFTYLRCQSLWGLYDPSVGSSPPKPPQPPDETKQKAFGYPPT